MEEYEQGHEEHPLDVAEVGDVEDVERFSLRCTVA